MSSQWSEAIKASLKRPNFLIVLAVLFAGAVGINAATSAMRLHFRKEAMQLRAKEGLTAVPEQLGTWVCVREPHTVNPDLAHDLGTDEYVFRTYVDTAATTGGTAGSPLVATRSDVLALEKLGDSERWAKLNDIRNKNPNAVMSFAVTYYTGKVDTVPHVPDRCYVADGYQPSLYDVKKWTLGDYTPGVPRVVPIRFIDFEDQTSRGAQNRCVTYFFHANGAYEDDPLMVRSKLQDLRQRYGYFAKIEVMTLLPNRPGATDQDPQKAGDRTKAAAAMQRFLTAALPEIEKLLPDWNARPK
ncbi:MAG TPA: hypothetical protein VH475_12745 [Tepidisphaeraceae bacterium]|jgi:hypothetical protein